MKLEEVGFYTLSDKRAREASWVSDLQRCELILTDRCNFSCPYCRGADKEWKGDLPLDEAKRVIKLWTDENLKNIRFSGGEPLLYNGLEELVSQAKADGVRRIAISSNGSLPFSQYRKLVKLGVNDFSISLDGCCAADCATMAGGASSFHTIIANIEDLSKICYVTIGIVLNDKNCATTTEIIKLASSAGADDIRIISAAQDTEALLRIKEQLCELPEELLEKHPILKYRVNNLINNRNVRGIQKEDTNKCHLLKDDMIVAGSLHFPCVIYMREHGKPIGDVNRLTRTARRMFFKDHDTHKDPICRKNCLDICIDHNNKCESEVINAEKKKASRGF